MTAVSCPLLIFEARAGSRQPRGPEPDRRYGSSNFGRAIIRAGTAPRSSTVLERSQ